METQGPYIPQDFIQVMPPPLPALLPGQVSRLEEVLEGVGSLWKVPQEHTVPHRLPLNACPGTRSFYPGHHALHAAPSACG